MAQEIADSTLLDTWASDGNIVEPDISKIIEGWQLGEQPPHEYMNWLQNTFGSKLNHILKNGVTNWNNETEYLAGSSVQHNGNVWLCKTTNTNSAPTDANANWKRIITVESLTTVLNGYIDTSSTQTIGGVKVFSSSPIVPTPTTANQAVNKVYVDNVATLNINDLTDKPTPSDTDNLVIQESGGLLKKLSWANLKATLLTYFDTFYSRTTNVFGIGQSIVDVTSLRAKGVNHTNDTNKTIFVMIKGAQNGFTTVSLTINGVVVMGSGLNTDAVWFPVPSGQIYNYNDAIAGTNAYKWIEYR